VYRLWPDPDPTAIDDQALTALYVPADRGRTCVRVNFVTSIDGAVTVDGYSEGLSGAADKYVFGRLRMLCDALLVGAGTLRHEGYRAVRLDSSRRAWRREHGLAECPPIVVVSHRLALEPTHPALAEAPVRPIVLTHAAAPAERRAALESVAEVLVCGETEVDLAASVAELAGRGLTQLLSEGGPHLLGSLTAADLVDEMCLTLSPLLAGPGAGRITAGPPLTGLPGSAPTHTRHLSLRHAVAADGALLLRYARQ
jgi:riboflavin biosynthesis pyrimidine reductase